MRVGGSLRANFPLLRSKKFTVTDSPASCPTSRPSKMRLGAARMGPAGRRVSHASKDKLVERAASTGLFERKCRSGLLLGSSPVLVDLLPSTYYLHFAHFSPFLLPVRPYYHRNEGEMGEMGANWEPQKVIEGRKGNRFAEKSLPRPESRPLSLAYIALGGHPRA